MLVGNHFRFLKIKWAKFTLGRNGKCGGNKFLFFLLIKQVIYQTTKWRIWGTYLLFGLLFVTALAINTWITNHLSSILLPKIWSILLALIIVVVTAIYRKEDLVKCIFLPDKGIQFCNGIKVINNKFVTLNQRF